VSAGTARYPEQKGWTEMIRTHEAGALRSSEAGQQVTLAGWVARRRDHGGVVFIDLRDGSGVVQVVMREEDVAHDLRAEFCVLVTGEVRRRPAGNENPELPTGDVEVAAERMRSCQKPTRSRSRSKVTQEGQGTTSARKCG